MPGGPGGRTRSAAAGRRRRPAAASNWSSPAVSIRCSRASRSPLSCWRRSISASCSVRRWRIWVRNSSIARAPRSRAALTASVSPANSVTAWSAASAASPEKSAGAPLLRAHSATSLTAVAAARTSVSTARRTPGPAARARAAATPGPRWWSRPTAEAGGVLRSCHISSCWVSRTLSWSVTRKSNMVCASESEWPEARSRRTRTRCSQVVRKASAAGPTRSPSSAGVAWVRFLRGPLRPSAAFAHSSRAVARAAVHIWIVIGRPPVRRQVGPGACGP